MSKNKNLAELINYVTVDTTSGNQIQFDGGLKQTSVISALLKANSTGVLVAATAGTDYLTSVGISNLTATGTPSATTYLRGDNTWATVSSTPTTEQVLTATAGASAGAVGTYALLGQVNNTGGITQGANYAGSSLRFFAWWSSNPFSNLALGSNQVGGQGTPSGTWKAISSVPGQSCIPFGGGLFLRVS